MAPRFPAQALHRHRLLPLPPSRGGGGTLFSDNFNRTDGSGLGANWRIVSGAWITDTRANADRDARDQAAVLNLSCGDCSVTARAVGFGDSTLTLDLRETAANDRRRPRAVAERARADPALEGRRGDGARRCGQRDSRFDGVRDAGVLSESRTHAVDRLRDAARERGANAVLAMRFDCNEIADIMSEVAAYGTAVTVRKL